MMHRKMKDVEPKILVKLYTIHPKMRQYWKGLDLVDPLGV
jgi:hypothetical protein